MTTRCVIYRYLYSAKSQNYIFFYVQFEYTYAGKENPVGNAILANLRGKFKYPNNPDKPKVRAS